MNPFDDNFIKELIERQEYIDAIATRENKDPLAIIEREYQGFLSEIETKLKNNATNLKKMRMGEKTGNIKNIDVVYQNKISFKKQGGIPIAYQEKYINKKAG